LKLEAKEKAAREAKLIAQKKKELEALERKARLKREKEEAEAKRKKALSQELKKDAVTKLKKRLTKEFTGKIDKLKKALEENKSQSKHRSIVEAENAAKIITKLTTRIDKLEKALTKREEDNKMLALAQKIKLEADVQAEKIATAAKADAKKLKARSARLHRKRLRRQLDRKNGFVPPPCDKRDPDEDVLDLEDQKALEKKGPIERQPTSTSTIKPQIGNKGLVA